MSHKKKKTQSQSKPKKDYSHEKCEVCGQPLTKPGGYEDTGMCGPCATGEAETHEEFGETW